MTKNEIKVFAIFASVISAALSASISGYWTYSVKQSELENERERFSVERASLEKERDRCWAVTKAALSEGCKLKLSVPENEVHIIQDSLPANEFEFRKRELPSGDYELMIFKKN